MLNDPKPSKVKDWVCIMERSTNYEVQLAKNFLNDREIPANILSKRDSAYSLNVGDMAHVYLYVPVDHEEEAREALAEWDDADSNSNDRNK
jgi:hypothetical protein